MDVIVWHRYGIKFVISGEIFDCTGYSCFGKRENMVFGITIYAFFKKVFIMFMFFNIESFRVSYSCIQIHAIFVCSDMILNLHMSLYP